MGGSASGFAGCPYGCGLMPLDDLQRQVAAVVLREAKRYGFALAGG